MTEKELIRAEIARYIREEVCSGYSSIACCRDLLKFIDSLPEVKPSRDLEEEVKRYYSDNFTYISSDQPTLSILTNVARHFVEWQKEQMEALNKARRFIPYNCDILESLYNQLKKL